MDRPLILIHGWSDQSTSFHRLVEVIGNTLNRVPKSINLADYISMDDEVTFDDLVTAMHHAWQHEALPQTPYATDVIVHSTGGLIIRDWITRYFEPETVPIKRLVMLAPANFGSQLAHKGQSFYGRIIKGFNSTKPFQIGQKILQGLELASPYTWNLAMTDRFSSKVYYGPRKILCTVLIGDTGFTGISAAANEEGSDGVVRATSANMNALLLEADFNHDPLRPTFVLQESCGKTAFGIIAGENHETLVGKGGGFSNEVTVSYLSQALTVQDTEFERWQTFLHQETAKLQRHTYQNSVFRVQDQFKNSVQDYFLEFYMNPKKQQWFAEVFHRDIIKTVHACSLDKSYRMLYLDHTCLEKQLQRPWESMNFSLTAMPALRHNGLVGYRTFSDKDIGSIVLEKSLVEQLFMPDQTLLVRLILKREQSSHLFQIKRQPS